MENILFMKKELQKTDFDGLYQKIADHINTARSNVVRSINTEQVKAYWSIGKDIVEGQAGKERADYSSYLLESISERLTKVLG